MYRCRIYNPTEKLLKYMQVINIIKFSRNEYKENAHVCKNNVKYFVINLLNCLVFKVVV